MRVWLRGACLGAGTGPVTEMLVSMMRLLPGWLWGCFVSGLVAAELRPLRGAWPSGPGPGTNLRPRSRTTERADTLSVGVPRPCGADQGEAARCKRQPPSATPENPSTDLARCKRHTGGCKVQASAALANTRDRTLRDAHGGCPRRE